MQHKMASSHSAHSDVLRSVPSDDTDCVPVREIGQIQWRVFDSHDDCNIEARSNCPELRRAAIVASNSNDDVTTRAELLSQRLPIGKEIKPMPQPISRGASAHTFLEQSPSTECCNDLRRSKSEPLVDPEIDFPVIYPQAKRELVRIMTESFDDLNEAWSKSMTHLYVDDLRSEGQSTADNLVTFKSDVHNRNLDCIRAVLSLLCGDEWPLVSFIRATVLQDVRADSNLHQRVLLRSFLAFREVLTPFCRRHFQGKVASGSSHSMVVGQTDLLVQWVVERVFSSIHPARSNPEPASISSTESIAEMRLAEQSMIRSASLEDLLETVIPIHGAIELHLAVGRERSAKFAVCYQEKVKPSDLCHLFEHIWMLPICNSRPPSQQMSEYETMQAFGRSNSALAEPTASKPRIIIWFKGSRDVCSPPKATAEAMLQVHRAIWDILVEANRHRGWILTDGVDRGISRAVGGIAQSMGTLFGYIAVCRVRFFCSCRAPHPSDRREFTWVHSRS